MTWQEDPALEHALHSLSLVMPLVLGHRSLLAAQRQVQHCPELLAQVARGHALHAVQADVQALHCQQLLGLLLAVAAASLMLRAPCALPVAEAAGHAACYKSSVSWLAWLLLLLLLSQKAGVWQA